MLSRNPTDSELAIVQGTLAEAPRAGIRADAAAAKQAIAIGESQAATRSLDPAELAAWTLVANLLLNLDETVTQN